MFAVAVLFVPGVWASFPFLMPGALAAGLGLAGLAVWESRPAPRPFTTDRRVVTAALLFAAAILTRETMIFIPAGIALAHMVRTRRLPSLWLAVGPVLYAAWWLVVRAMTGAPLNGQDQTRADAPGAGFLDAAGSWSLLGRDWLFVVATVGLLAVAWWRRSPGDHLLYGAILGLLAASLMNLGVWGSWVNWTRAVLPVHLALALMVIESTLRPETVSSPEPDAPAPQPAIPVGG